MDGVNFPCSKKIFRTHKCADRQEGFNSRGSRQVKPLPARLAVFYKGIELPTNNKHHDKECYLYRPSQFLGIKSFPFVFNGLFLVCFDVKNLLRSSNYSLWLFCFFQVSYLPEFFNKPFIIKKYFCIVSWTIWATYSLPGVQRTTVFFLVVLVLHICITKTLDSPQGKV